MIEILAQLTIELSRKSIYSPIHTAQTAREQNEEEQAFAMPDVTTYLYGTCHTYRYGITHFAVRHVAHLSVWHVRQLAVLQEIQYKPQEAGGRKGLTFWGAVPGGCRRRALYSRFSRTVRSSYTMSSCKKTQATA